MLRIDDLAWLFVGRYNFNKVSKYRPLTLEEAEEKIKFRRKCVEGYQRRWMKVADNGAAAFGEVEEIERCDGGVEGGHHRKENGDDDEDTVLSERGDIERGMCLPLAFIRIVLFIKSDDCIFFSHLSLIISHMDMLLFLLNNIHGSEN